MKVVVHTDGGSRGNPGKAAVGYCVEEKNTKKFCYIARPVGIQTNNIAEYMALCDALEICVANEVEEAEIYMDSELIVKQIQGIYKVKNEGLRPFYDKAVQLLHKISKHTISHVPRNENKVADKLVNRALDSQAEIYEGDLFQRDFVGVHDIVGADEKETRCFQPVGNIGAKTKELLEIFVGMEIEYSYTEDAIYLKGGEKGVSMLMDKRLKILEQLKAIGFSKVMLDLEMYDE